jgi:hypothetical protein
MKRCFALTCLTVALIAVATGCGPKKSLRAKKSKATETVVPSEATAPAPAPAVAAAPAPVAPAGAGGASGSGMAVVILMLPGSETKGGVAASRPGAPHTYQLSLSADANSAVIQVDGQPAVTAPVQRIYPSTPSAPSPSRAPAVAALRAPAVVAPRPVAAPARNRYLPPPVAQPEIGYDGTFDVGEARARQARRAAITTAMRPPLPPPVIANPNGAPIID